jgi:hypothetical protein
VGCLEKKLKAQVSLGREAESFDSAFLFLNKLQYPLPPKSNCFPLPSDPITLGEKN